MSKLPIEKASARLKSAMINRALGIFILFFGVVVIFSMLFTTTAIGQMTNLAAGLVVSVIGGTMIWRAFLTLRSLSDKP